MSDESNTSSTGGYLAPSELPPEDAELDRVLQQLVSGVTGIPGRLVRPRWQQIPQATPEVGTDWCAIGVTEEVPEPNIALTHDASDDGGRGSSTSYDVDVVTVMASFYGPRARGNAKLLRVGLMIAQNRETLVSTGLNLVEAPGQLVFVPETINELTQRRADITMRFRRRTAIVWSIENILSLDGSIQSGEGGVVTLGTPSSFNPLEE